MSNDININESEILESLNAKIDYDGGNYKGSGLANYVVDKAGDTMTGTLNITGMSDGICQQRFVNGNYGLMFRQDSSDFYMLLTNKDDPYGQWNDLRPFSINLSTGDFNFMKCTTRPTATSTASTGKVAVVIQNYLSGNSWYRVWSDGFIEQGGVLSCTGGQDRTVTFLKAFATDKYTVAVNWYHSGAHNFDDILMTHSKAAGSFHIYAGETGAGGAVTMNANWLAMGY